MTLIMAAIWLAAWVYTYYTIGPSEDGDMLLILANIWLAASQLKYKE